jgi:hypothetical protein
VQEFGKHQIKLLIPLFSKLSAREVGNFCV